MLKWIKWVELYSRSTSDCFEYKEKTSKYVINICDFVIINSIVKYESNEIAWLGQISFMWYIFYVFCELI